MWYHSKSVSVPCKILSEQNGKKSKMVNLIADGILSKITEINSSLNAFDSG